VKVRQYQTAKNPRVQREENFIFLTGKERPKNDEGMQLVTNTEKTQFHIARIGRTN
jgi:hypothetical protein